MVGLDNSSTVLDMSLAAPSGPDLILSDTDLTLSVLGFWFDYEAFVIDEISSVVSLPNIALINVTSLQSSTYSPDTDSQLWQRRDNTIIFNFESVNFIASDIIDLEFGLFELGSSTPFFEADLDSYIHMDSTNVYIQIKPEDIDRNGYVYFELVSKTQKSSQLISGTINIVSTKL